METHLVIQILADRFVALPPHAVSGYRVGNILTLDIQSHHRRNLPLMKSQATQRGKRKSREKKQ
jgi:hypothetical protein